MDLGLIVTALAASAFGAIFYFRLRRRQKIVTTLEKANAELSARARMLADNAQQAIVGFDARGLIRRVNPAAEKLFGYREPELYGQSFLRLMPERPTGRGGEADVRCKDGTRMRRRFSAARSGDANQPGIYLFFEVDAPVRQQVLEETEPGPQPASQAGLESTVNRIVRQFEGLLTVISGYTELALHATPQSSPIRKDLEEVAVASDAASNLARNLLTYSGRQTIPVESIDLNALVGSLEAGIREAMRAPMDVDLALDRPTVFGNGECLSQILMILCTSAHHRVHDGRRSTGRVRICTEKRRMEKAQPVHTGKVPAGVYGVLAVSDSGPALDPTTLAQLFEPLFMDREALGVELSPVHGIVRNLGGWIDVISTENAGTTFEVLFPYAGDAQMGSGTGTTRSLVEG